MVAEYAGIYQESRIPALKVVPTQVRVLSYPNLMATLEADTLTGLILLSSAVYRRSRLFPFSFRTTTTPATLANRFKARLIRRIPTLSSSSATTDRPTTQSASLRSISGKTRASS